MRINGSTVSVIDAHHHVGSLVTGRGAGTGGSTARDPSGGPVDDDVDLRCKFMDTHGIDQAIVLPAFGGEGESGPGATRRSNDLITQYRARCPDRFPVAIGSVDFTDAEVSVEEIQRCVGELGMGGIAWHHRFQGVPLDHWMMRPWLEAMDELGSVALIHVIADSTLESPWRLEILADDFPGVKFLALDAFSAPHQAQWMCYLAKRHDNIWFDTGVLVSVAHSLERFVEEVGAHRLLYGSDFYSAPRLYTRPFPLYEIANSDWDVDTKAKILGDNACTLFGIRERLPPPPQPGSS